MKRYVLQARKAFFLKITLNCVLNSILSIFKENKENSMVYIACNNICTIGIDIFEIHGSVLSNFVIPFISYLLLLNDFFKEWKSSLL